MLLTLTDLLHRDPAPDPWAAEHKIPWDEPAFSRRMLAEHLSQAHDAASRRQSRIDQHVRWIHKQVLHSRSSRILDLGCGPGLYATTLAQLGHACTGIDFGPAAIEYAKEISARECLGNHYVLGDIRAVEYGNGYDLVMLIFGEMNVFSPSDARSVLRKACSALAPDGQLLLEVHTEQAVQTQGRARATWNTRERGLFSPRPHLLLEESIWHESSAVAMRRYFVVDAATANVTRYAQAVQAYSSQGYAELLAECGFHDQASHPSLSGIADDPEFAVLLAAK